MNKMYFSQVLDDNYERFNVHMNRLKVISDGINENLPSNIEPHYDIDFFPIVQMNDISDNLKEINSLIETENKSIESTNTLRVVRSYIIKVFEMVDNMLNYMNSRDISSLRSLNNELQHILTQY